MIDAADKATANAIGKRTAEMEVTKGDKSSDAAKPDESTQGKSGTDTQQSSK